ncbi:hypothetical protein L218DRAFT_959014 [Marasmius fiardii PR-910]|nr:hypothetical protein L218DRAFT_959014 [Marasmius fiardii PR-910]
MPSILFVFTSADKNLLGEHTGYFLPEAAHPYYTLAPKFTIYFASPKGPNPPADEDSVKLYAQKECAHGLNDQVVKACF